MKYLVNTQLRADGSLLVDAWQEVEADSRLDALRIAVKDMDPSLLPFTVYVSDNKLLHPNGVPMVTHGYTLIKEA